MSALEAGSVRKELQNTYDESLKKLEQLDSLEAFEQLRVQVFGKKSKFAEVLSQLKSMSNEDRKVIGQAANQLKSQLQNFFDKKRVALEESKLEKALENDQLDASLPGVSFARGQRHPVSKTLQEAVAILERAGLKAVYGPEVEYEEYNFDRLNFKTGHPARDMQATFFVPESVSKKNSVLRTHTSPVQVRVLLEQAKKGFEIPIRIQAPGRVYRVDDDATHSPMFHQIEGLVVDKHSGMGELKAVIDFFLRNFFENENTRTRFRPSYFPFTEPSAEVDVSCVFCSGDGCKVCKGSGWLEVGGAGLVHPEVFRSCGWDPDQYQGWAFGMGIERLAMLKLQIPDLRSFFENRLSFLRGEAS